MIFEQYFDEDTYTYTYLIGDEKEKLAVLIDPVDTQNGNYTDQLKRKGLRLLATLDTHTHADHISANGVLREKTGCITYLGKESLSECVDNTFRDGDVINIGTIKLQVIHTPGHTDDSYSFYMLDGTQGYLFTGDTLLINGSGRTDFQNGDAHDQYRSIFTKLLNYPDDTRLYPGHDYNGKKVSTVGAEKTNNPRLQVDGEQAYVELMSQLKLPNPKYMDIAVPANQACGKVN